MKTEEMSTIFFEGFLSADNYLIRSENNPMERLTSFDWRLAQNTYAKEANEMPSPTDDQRLKGILWEKGFVVRMVKLGL